MNNSGLTQRNWHFDRSEQKRLKQLHILKAAAQCFNEKGYSGTALKDVAERLNLTDAALYYYVRNKEELVNLCYLRATDLAKEALARAIAEGKNPVDQLELYIRFQIECLTGIEGPVAIMSEVSSLREAYRKPLLKRATQHQKNITAIIENAIADGSIDTSSAIMASNALLGAINWIPKWYRSDSKLTSKAIADNFIHLFLNGMLSRNLGR